LVDWEDPTVLAEIKSVLPAGRTSLNSQTLFPSLVLHPPAQSFYVRFLGVGDHVTLAKAYRDLARTRGWLGRWNEKLRPPADRLPAAPASGGDEGRAQALHRVRTLGYRPEQYDHRQPMCRGAPSWPEGVGRRQTDESSARGEPWAGGHVIPLFELVDRNWIALGGACGQDLHQAAADVLHHAVIARPLQGPSLPPHSALPEATHLEDEPAIEPCRPELEELAPRELRVSYQWIVHKTPRQDWQVFVHFTDPEGRIYQQNDHTPPVPTSQWLPGRIESAAFTLTLSEALRGTLDVRVGLWDPATGRRARLSGLDDGSQRYLVGRLRLGTDRSEMLPPLRRALAADAGAFTRGDNGWSAGQDPLDRFAKNTGEILLPLHELTARSEMTGHAFLTRDRRVQRSVFGQGRQEVTVTANFGDAVFVAASALGGEVRLPPYGLLVESPTFVAFHASSWNGLDYDRPVLFTLRSLSGQPLVKASRVQIFHGFGDARLRWRHTILEVEKERVVDTLGP